MILVMATERAYMSSFQLLVGSSTEEVKLAALFLSCTTECTRRTFALVDVHWVCERPWLALKS
jgi:hypothetical protein